MSKRMSNGLLCLGMYFIGLLFIAMSTRLNYPSNVFPYLVSTAILVFTTVIFLTQVAWPAPHAEGEASASGQGGISVPRVILMAGASIVYAVLMPLVGFYTVSFIFLVVLFTVTQLDRFNGRLLGASVGLSLAILLVIYVAFSLLLSVPTPRGLVI